MRMTDSQKWLVLAGGLLFGGLLVLLAPILSPFLTAVLLAYLGDPLVDKLEEWKLSRTNGVIVTFLVLMLILGLAALLLIPALVQQVDELIKLVPKGFVWFKEVATPYLENRFGIELIQFDWLELSKKLDWGATGNVVKAIMANVTQSGMALISFVGNLVLIPVVTFYLLRDWDVLVERIGSLIPRYYIGPVSDLAKQCHETLGAFFRGQLLVMLALGIIYAIGMMLVGVDLGLLIGMLAGLASIVPYLGAIVGIGAGLIAAFFQFGDILHLVLVIIVFAVGQTLEGTVLTPKLVGDRIGLHPVAVIFAVLAGGQLFGFVGILLALPAAAVIMVMLRRIHFNYRASSLYGEPLADSIENEQELQSLAEQVDGITDAEDPSMPDDNEESKT
ncbi:MAG: AI-2E family transporter [Reinekea sp.]|nr:AI-2E family transporter [Reinekea sp.]